MTDAFLKGQVDAAIERIDALEKGLAALGDRLEAAKLDALERAELGQAQADLGGHPASSALAKNRARAAARRGGHK